MGGTKLTTEDFRHAYAHPQNAMLFADEVLAKIADKPSSIREAVHIAKSELLARLLLNPDRYAEPVRYRWRGLTREYDVRRALGDWLGEDFLKDFLTRAEACGTSCGRANKRQRVGKLLQTLEDNSRLDCHERVCISEMIRPYAEADGVIPVFRGEDGYLLPFSFTEESGSPAVYDLGGRKIEPWSSHFAELVGFIGDGEGKICRNVRVGVWQDEIFKDAEGRSLLLPILAAWRRCGVAEDKRLPYYNPLRFMLTGDIHGGHLKQVDVGVKEGKIMRDVRDGVLVYPGTAIAGVRLREGAEIPEILECVRRMAEREWATAPKCAAKRLLRLDSAVRRAIGAEWDGTIARIDRLGACFDREIDAEAWLNWQMLRSVARCHAGRTEEAHQINLEAAAFAASRPKFAAQQLRLQIEELVLLQDEEKFEDVFRLAGGVEDGIGKLANAGADGKTCADLLMRYHGTMGQAKAYAAIGGNGGESAANESRRHFEAAYGYALELAQADDAYVADCCQDANYLVLWEALFGSGGVVEAAAKARGMCNRLRACDGGDEAAAKNDKFRHRFEALARYRAVLDGRDVPEFNDEDFSGEMSGGGGWVEATIRKYEGAVAAKAGDLARARELFEGAAGLMERYGRGILGTIRMTVHAEAYRSLRGLDGDAAERHRAEALRLIDAGVAGSVDGDGGWRRWLEQGGTDETFPGLHWWY